MLKFIDFWKEKNIKNHYWLLITNKHWEKLIRLFKPSPRCTLWYLCHRHTFHCIFLLWNLCHFSISVTVAPAALFKFLVTWQWQVMSRPLQPPDSQFYLQLRNQFAQSDAETRCLKYFRRQKSCCGTTLWLENICVSVWFG